MCSWFTFWLIRHIVAVIIAFAPPAAFDLIGCTPGATWIFTPHADPWHSEWLLLAIVRYALLFFYVLVTILVLMVRRPGDCRSGLSFRGLRRSVA